MQHSMVYFFHHYELPSLENLEAATRLTINNRIQEVTQIRLVYHGQVENELHEMPLATSDNVIRVFTNDDRMRRAIETMLHRNVATQNPTQNPTENPEAIPLENPTRNPIENPPQSPSETPLQTVANSDPASESYSADGKLCRDRYTQADSELWKNREGPDHFKNDSLALLAGVEPGTPRNLNHDEVESASAVDEDSQSTSDSSHPTVDLPCAIVSAADHCKYREPRPCETSVLEEQRGTDEVSLNSSCKHLNCSGVDLGHSRPVDNDAAANQSQPSSIATASRTHNTPVAPVQPRPLSTISLSPANYAVILQAGQTTASNASRMRLQTAHLSSLALQTGSLALSPTTTTTTATATATTTTTTTSSSSSNGSNLDPSQA